MPESGDGSIPRGYGRSRPGTGPKAGANRLGVPGGGNQTRPVEGYGNDTYGERYAGVYDDWYGGAAIPGAAVGTPDEVADRLAALAGPGGRVLELGVGTGRLALPMADRGLAVTGLDSSTAMLDHLRAKPGADRVVAVVGDMADPVTTVERPASGFDAVLVGFNTFFNLASEADQTACLDGVARLLRPGGHLVLEAWVPSLDDPVGPLGGPAGGTVGVRSIEVDRVVLDVVAVDEVAQTVTSQRIEMTADGNRFFPSVLRYATPDQLDAMAADAGLTLAERHEDWVGTPFTHGSTTQVATWRLEP